MKVTIIIGCIMLSPAIILMSTGNPILKLDMFLVTTKTIKRRNGSSLSHGYQIHLLIPDNKNPANVAGFLLHEHGMTLTLCSISA